MKLRICYAIFLLAMTPLLGFASSPITIVAAENFYADVAQQLGGPYVKVNSILNNPNQDPHLFSANPKIAILLANADIIIENGVNYDSWMDTLRMSSSHAMLINVSDLLAYSPKNPHLWYDPIIMPLFAQKLTQELIQKDSAHRAYYQTQLTIFLEQANQYQKRIHQALQKTTNLPVTATEPIANDLLMALHCHILNQPFQWAVMNGADLTPQEIMQFENSLQRVKLFLYNQQVLDPTVQHLKVLAQQNHIPIIGVTEMMPVHEHYYDWMNKTLDDILRAV